MKRRSIQIKMNLERFKFIILVASVIYSLKTPDPEKSLSGRTLVAFKHVSRLRSVVELQLLFISLHQSILKRTLTNKLIITTVTLAKMKHSYSKMRKDTASSRYIRCAFMSPKFTRLKFFACVVIS